MIASIGSTELYNRAIDVGGPDSMTCKEMMIQTAKVMHKKRKLVDIPFLTINLSRLWVSQKAGIPPASRFTGMHHCDS
ncbi:hypothetical protein A3842_28505 [Paenibacillus sp. P3E]|uniref:hypothetical protein n=1 Tax=Paenibacillus sp. P3E TaxID=1349435 RepID=UPI00093BD6D8|nr:hypothetical protein [Paenibacillus sp. P3E]OKP67127.1 hypothetical protein A3842_28505 [Paenibacillus sp. P3E]